jgi:hypothetical protein
MISDEELIAAIDRIGMTPDGEMLYLYLQKRLTRVLHTVEPGALQTENGVRILASDLMGFLSAGLNEAYAGARSDRIVTFKLPERVEQRGPGTAAEFFAAERRRITGEQRGSNKPEPFDRSGTG